MTPSHEWHSFVKDMTSTPDDPDGRTVTDDQERDPATRPHMAKAGSTNGTTQNGGGVHEGDGQASGDRTAASTSAPADPPVAQPDATPPVGEAVAPSVGPPTTNGAGEATAASTASGDVKAVDPAADDTVFLRPQGSSASRVDAATASASTPPEGQRPVGKTSSTARLAARAAAATTAFRKASAPDDATADLRLPKAANGVASGAGQTAGQKAQTVGPRRTDPAAIPPPGPSAATPPPWHRAPGQEPAPAPAPVENGLNNDSMFDDSDGPTAFLQAPRATPDGEGTSQSAGTATPSRSGRARPPRQASLQLKRLDPWSVLKLALVLAVVLFFIWLVAVGVLYGVLDGIGVWDRLNGTYADLVSGEAPSGSPLISAGRVFGIAAVVGAINSLLFAVAVTVGAFVYNVSADLVGGIEVTLSERD